MANAVKKFALCSGTTTALCFEMGSVKFLFVTKDDVSALLLAEEETDPSQGQEGSLQACSLSDEWRGTLSKKTSLEAEVVLVIHTWDGKCGTEDIHNEEGINENLVNDSDTSRII